VFTRASATANQFATAVALDTLPQSGASLALYNALLFLTSEAEAQSAFDQLSGEAYASTKGMFIEQSGLIRTAMIDRLRASFGAVAASSAPVIAYAAPSGLGATEAGMALKAVAAPATTENFAMWTTGFGSWGELDGNGNAASLSSSTGGFLIGADATISASWRVGVTGGYSYTDFDVDDRASSGDSENWHIGVYGGNQWGPLGLRTGIAYSFHDVETSRAVGFTGYSDYLTGSYDAGTFQAFGELGYRMDTAFAVAFEPFANLAYVSLHTDGFGETGGAAALASDSSTTDTSFTTLGLRASTQMLLGSAATTLRGALGWRHAFGDVVPVATQSFLGSDSFTVSGTPIAEDAALIEAGLDVAIGASVTLGAAYTGQFGDGVTQNGFNATLKVSF
jgi:outer membrane autotransporter protein